MNHKERLRELRKLLAEKKLDGFLVPMNDEYQNEYIPDSAKRLEWLTGFSGSAGTVITLRNKAAIFVDGRYVLQAETQVDGDLYEKYNIKETNPSSWLKENAAKGVIGYDPKLYTESAVKKMEFGGIKLKPVKNLIDRIWVGKPSPPDSMVKIHPVKYAGKSSLEKREEVAKIVKEKGADLLLLTLADSICWLFNIRGDDVDFTPLALCFALLGKDGKAEIFIDPRRLDSHVRDYFAGWMGVNDIKDLEKNFAKNLAGKTVLADHDNTAAWFFNILEKAGAKTVKSADPVIAMKAIKNKTEIKGARNAHIRDGIALVKFFTWLSENIGKNIDEIKAADKLEEIRSRSEMFSSLSFATISGMGGNGAIVHYRSSPKTAKRIKTGGLYLLDSGAQYFDGTTDVTRTIAIGRPSKEQKENFTRVLKGHIAIARAKFPEGTAGGELDALARYHLWQAGLDYDHGTGHGVGSFLGVHEGPQRISRRSDVPLKSGMVISNEPGYYKSGEYGIRIENLVLVRKAKDLSNAKKKFLEFETLTAAPIDLRLVEKNMLTDEELGWLESYHKSVFFKLSPHLDEKEIIWLKEAITF